MAVQESLDPRFEPVAGVFVDVTGSGVDLVMGEIAGGDRAERLENAVGPRLGRSPL
jgi:hypothetical protein